MSDTSPAPDRQQRLEAERAALDRLSRLNGALELQAAVLALLLPEHSKRAARAWEIETDGTPGADALRTQVGDLSAAARLPQFEALVSRMRGQPLAERQNLLEATRRVMGARGTVRPIDRLHWLAMRQRLGGPSAATAQRAAAADLSLLPQADVAAIAAYSAFLSRLVPIDTAEATPATDTTETPPGAAWYDTAMAPWRANAEIPPCQPPDSDGLVHALQALQALPWMQRPMLVRGWVTAALQHSRHGRIEDTAADALRLSSTLLDSPLPPELARHYGVNAQEMPR